MSFHTTIVSNQMSPHGKEEYSIKNPNTKWKTLPVSQKVMGQY